MPRGITGSGFHLETTLIKVADGSLTIPSIKNMMHRGVIVTSTGYEPGNTFA
jgi:hypothetical protein